MKISLLSVGTRMPAWVEEGVQTYCKRLPADFSLKCVEVPLARRGKNADIDRARNNEGDDLLARIPRNDVVIAMEVGGKPLTTDQLARRLDQFRSESRNVSLLVGGPDGLDVRCRERADEQWSLSALTLPHPLVRIVIAEQIYRAWSLLAGHPYHRA